jgi:hypothetical protein
MSSIFDFLNPPGCERPFPSCSGLDLWIGCRRAWWLNFVKRAKRRPEKLSDAMKMGRLWDDVQESFFGASTLSQDFVEIPPGFDEFAHAKVRAMFKAFGKLFDPDVLGRFSPNPCQVVLKREIGPESARIVLHGHLDRRKSETSFAESKFTSKPDLYGRIITTSDQMATYFLLDPDFKSATLEIATAPQLKPKNTESADSFGERCYKDILRRPRFYFNNYDKSVGTYGLNVWRNADYDIPALERRILFMLKEIKDALTWPDQEAAFYQRKKSCFTGYSKCMYFEACESGFLSPLLYEMEGENADL